MLTTAPSGEEIATAPNVKEITREISLTEVSVEVTSRSDGYMPPTLAHAMSKHQLVLHKSEHMVSVHGQTGGLKETFKLLDTDGDGEIDKSELCELINAAQHKCNFHLDEITIQKIADALLSDVDKDDSGTIDVDEFVGMFTKNKKLMALFTKQPATTAEKNNTGGGNDKNHDNMGHNNSRKGKRPTLHHADTYAEPRISVCGSWAESKRHQLVALRNKRLYGWITFYGIVNLAFFVYKYIQYYNRPEAQAVMGHCICIARGSAQAINFNSFLILLPMCKHVMTYIRQSRLRFILPLDLYLETHMMIGTALVMFAIAHVFAHICDFVLIADTENASDKELEALFGGGVSFPSTSGERWGVLLSSRAAITGFLMCLCFAVAYPLSLTPGFFPRIKKAIRMKSGTFFNAFWYAHHLFVLALALLCVHGTQNLLEHFQTLFWVGVPLLCYVLSKILRAIQRPVKVISATAKSGDVLELRLEKPASWKKWPLCFGKDRLQPGMYAFLNIPSISSTEWHPFSLTSAPGDDFIEFHIRSVGDWTNALLKTFQNGGEKAMETTKVFVDGPLGASSEGYLDYDIVVLIGAGIGITPMASIVRHLISERDGLKKAYFFWATRDRSAFGWFKTVMEDLYEHDKQGVAELHNFLTRAKEDSSDLGTALLEYAREIKFKSAGEDLVLGMHSTRMLELGRPKWDSEFKLIRDKALELGVKKVGVFFCGPLRMGSAISKSCEIKGKSGVEFVFTKETF
jgi:respiratory burst oxidase